MKTPKDKQPVEEDQPNRAGVYRDVSQVILFKTRPHSGLTGAPFIRPTRAGGEAAGYRSSEIRRFRRWPRAAEERAYRLFAEDGKLKDQRLHSEGCLIGT